MLKSILLRSVICVAFVFSPLASVAEIITKDGVEFTLDDQVNVQYPELIALIMATESMDDEERQYWFDILPSMTEAQVDRLYDILETERKKLVALEEKYLGEIQNLNFKHLLEWQQRQIKERFEDAPDDMRNTYLPIIQLDFLDKVSIRLFNAYDDIPKVALNAIIPDYDSDEQVLALLLPEYYQKMIDDGILTVDDGAALARYAEVLIENRAFYEAFWGEEFYAKFIRIGADQRKRSGHLRMAQEMAKRVPDILNSSNFELPADSIARLIKEIEEIPTSDSKFRVYNTMNTLNALTILLDDPSCDDTCLMQYKAGINFVLDQLEKLKSEVMRIAERRDGENYITWMSFYGLQLSLSAILSEDYAAKSNLKAAAEDFNTFYLSLLRSRLNETYIRWNTDDDDENLRAFLLNGIQSNGKWRSKQAEFAWYAEFLDHFAAGTLPALTDAMERIWNEESGAHSYGNLNILEGPLLEAQTWSAVQMLASGQCSSEMGRMESYIRRALNHGQDPNSSAYRYYEKSVIKVISSPRLTRFNCVGEAQEALARDDWYALLIGLADTTPGAPGYDLPKADQFYLGDVPDNDVNLMEVALNQSDIRWNVTKLQGEKVTGRNIRATLSKIVQSLDGDDHLMVYYSGHGMKIEGDIGTFIMLRNGEEFDIGALTARMNKSNAKHSVLILDTCRTVDNPVEAAQLKSTSGSYKYSKNLSADNATLAQSMSIIYSTSDNAPAHVAPDGKHSVFTKHFATVLGGTRRPNGVEGAEISLLAAYRDVGEQLSTQPGAVVQYPDREVFKGQMDWAIARYRNR